MRRRQEEEQWESIPWLRVTGAETAGGSKELARRFDFWRIWRDERDRDDQRPGPCIMRKTPRVTWMRSLSIAATLSGSIE